jgi:hypothetical protein
MCLCRLVCWPGRVYGSHRRGGKKRRLGDLKQLIIHENQTMKLEMQGLKYQTTHLCVAVLLGRLVCWRDKVCIVHWNGGKNRGLLQL